MIGGWAAALRRLTLAGAILLVLGWWQGQALLFLLAGAVAYLLWNLLNLYRLESWVSDPTAPNPPDVPGIWGQVFYRIAGIQRKNRKQKKRMAKLLVEFRKSTEAMPDAAVILDQNDRIGWLNSAAEKLLGLNRDGDYGQRIDNLLRAPGFRAYLNVKDFAEPLMMASPQNDQLLLSTRIVPYGKGQRLLLARDVTERAETERMRRDFVANASHELRTPITVLSGYLESMSDDAELPEKWQRPVQEMRRQASRMEGLVADLLELSRLESPTRSMLTRSVDVASLLAAVSRDHPAAVGQAPVRVAIESDMHLLADPEALQSVCENLASNALRYTPADGYVELGWRTDRQGGYLWVRDSGQGIEPEHLPRITERFYRADPGRSSAQGGTGLGLAIVKHILERHEGRLDITSKPGKGSLFCCFFPPERLVSETPG